MYENYSMPIYQKIALDIASGIYKGNIEEGKKLHGRSTLAGKYNVSPETIRRAIKLLEDVNVVHSSKGSGITVLSKDNAFKFINKFQNIESIASCKTTLADLIIKKQKLEDEIMETMNKIVDHSGRLSNITPITPLEIKIPASSKLIGKSISETKFWQNTGATIVGIKRGGSLILSPGPYATFNKDDVLLLIGDEKVYNSAKIFLSDD
ncbi:MAG: GntR family transcriptional regulator [Clostridium argentinense]|uniref:TrkA C-terminal domain-containing protein n=1 Tax=Clostridium butanoliproducens TaxID=2991837 RepID=UPI001D1A88A7|nr:TrkA C-terminal domain-containing protein [Clostridium butanoliproducens]MBS5822482.1 GntR family transcriptional regulator [Clostridium argentinense]MDU1350112.1 TrkA C-terminal domain-containing protein [Clostridium argentinense]